MQTEEQAQNYSILSLVLPGSEEPEQKVVTQQSVCSASRNPPISPKERVCVCVHWENLQKERGQHD